MHWMQHFQCQKVSKLMQTYIESLIRNRFNHDQITDVPEPVPVHLWLDHKQTVKTAYQSSLDCLTNFGQSLTVSCFQLKVDIFLQQQSKEIILFTINKKLTRRWDSEREISLRSDHTRTTKYNRLVHKFRHRSTWLCVRTQVYQIQWNSTMQRPLRWSRSFKITDFGTKWKLIYDFLLVINTNLPPILHRF